MNLINKKPLKFIIAGASAALLEFLSFIFFVNTLESSGVIAQTVSYLFGFALSFTLHRGWVFRSSGSIEGEFVKYSILAGVNIILTNLVLHSLINFGVNINLSKIFVMGMVALWNYLIFNKIIFKNQNKEKKKVEE